MQVSLTFFEIVPLGIDTTNPAFFPLFKTLPERFFQNDVQTSGSHGFLSVCYGVKVIYFKISF